ncbi:MAG: pseudaminic acid synthase [Bacteroidetes bacterium]|nr:pseudaminic acid synthase [Bacteroidota bacterium]
MEKTIDIGKAIVGKDKPAFIIAEMSANHNQDFSIAVETVRAAKEVGANAIKLQTYTPDTITIDCKNKYFQINQGTLWDGKTLYELYQEAYTPWQWQPELKRIADDLGLICFSSPFDKTAVDFLEEMDVPAYKVASFEITDIPLIRYIATKGKPVIISTGVATLEDIEEAVATCRDVGNEQIILLKCTSSYPTLIEESNLKNIIDLANRFDVISGLSDHSLGITVPITAIALGAKVIEKHFILNKSLGGPDVAFSLDMTEFKKMVTAVREAEKALGNANYELSEKTKKSRNFSRSLFAVKDISAGELFTEENIRSIRPGYGIAPKYLPDILGKISKRDIKKGTPLNLNMIDR